MKTGFKDPIAPKPGRTRKSPWNFQCPPYDERSSCFITAGSHCGVGHKNPIGHKGNPKRKAETLPYGKVKTLETSYVPPKILNQEFIE